MCVCVWGCACDMKSILDSLTHLQTDLIENETDEMVEHSHSTDQ